MSRSVMNLTRVDKVFWIMTMNTGENLKPAYGQGDASFQAAGGQQGLRCLVDAFYDQMEQ